MQEIAAVVNPKPRFAWQKTYREGPALFEIGFSPHCKIGFSAAMSFTNARDTFALPKRFWGAVTQADF
jgi:hypothetical protein